MSILRITGGNSLDGSVAVHGAKNSVLPIMAAALLTRGETVIHNCPNLSDVSAAVKILQHLGCVVSRKADSVYIDSTDILRYDIPDDLMREMRSSVIFLGAILARCGEAILSMPGGCELGPRPIDLHLGAMRALGAEIDEHGGNIICRAATLRGCEINLSLPSVGATENAMIAASRAEGTTIITNAACEPEIWDLARFLNNLGVSITGAGSPTICIIGTKESRPVEHTVIADRIVTATYLSAAAATRGNVEITGIVPEHISTVTDALKEMGCKIKKGKDSIYIKASKGKLSAIKPVITKPYPGFPTDAQPPVMAACLAAEGTTVFVENIFENRYRHAGELLRMGADIKLEGRVAMVSGVKKLHAAPVAATDLRGGAALVIAALAAEGTTEISAISHIDRGYDDLHTSLRQLGASIDRID